MRGVPRSPDRPPHQPGGAQETDGVGEVQVGEVGFLQDGGVERKLVGEVYIRVRGHRVDNAGVLQAQ